MKKLIVLGGNSPKNKQWGEEVLSQYGGWFDQTYRQDYSHWESGEEAIDFEGEVEKLRIALAEDKADTEYYIIAKSFGTVLSTLAIDGGVVQPKKCVFFGMPLNIVAEQNIFGESWTPLHALTMPVLVLHNMHDPVADFAFVKQTLDTESVPTITLMPLDGDTHGYTELDEYEVKVRTFLEI